MNKKVVNTSNLAKCTYCDAEMIERTNDNKLECLNCGKPFTMPVRPIATKTLDLTAQMGIKKDS